MKKTSVVGAVCAVAVFAGVVYFARDSAGPAPPAAEVPADKAAAAAASEPAASTPLAAPAVAPLARPVPSDPRLAALMVSPPNALIEFIADANGKVIKEIDNDPASPGYLKPLREYTYAGDQVIRLVSYKYLGDQTQIVRADVVYKPDGSVDQYRESTGYEHGKRN